MRKSIIVLSCLFSCLLAQDALAAIKVEYEVVPCVATVEDAMKPDAPKVFAKRDNVVEGQSRSHGDPEAALKSADATVSATYRTQVQMHTALETHGVVANWESWVKTGTRMRRSSFTQAEAV